MTLAAFTVATLSVIFTPIFALSWANRPFPGIVMDHTLVVTDQGGGRLDGPGRGDRPGTKGLSASVGTASTTTRNTWPRWDSLNIGDNVSITTRTKDGTDKFFPSVALRGLPDPGPLPALLDALPDGAGLPGHWGLDLPGAGGDASGTGARLLLLRRSRGAGAVVRHLHDPRRHAAVGYRDGPLGGALLSLAMRFPQEARIVRRYPGVLGIPYLASIAIGVWAAATLYDTAHPWDYLIARDVSYRYTGIGGLLFLGVMFVRAFQSGEATVRRQARIVLLGSAIAFLPIIFWILTPLAGVRLHFEPALYMPWLVIFPFCVAIAIFRYRLLEMDAIVNRTILWGLLTAVLAGVISVSITVLQKVFQLATGEKSDIAVVLTSLILVSVFTPVKTRLQAFLDRRFKDSPEHILSLNEFGGEVRSYLQMSDRRLMTKRLLDEAAAGMGAEPGAITMQVNGNGRLEPLHTYGDWRGEAWSRPAGA